MIQTHSCTRGWLPPASRLSCGPDRLIRAKRRRGTGPACRSFRERHRWGHMADGAKRTVRVDHQVLEIVIPGHGMPFSVDVVGETAQSVNPVSGLAKRYPHQIAPTFPRPPG